MVVLSNTVAQTLQPGQALAFDKLVAHSGCGECARSGGPVGLRFNGTYRVTFHGNVTGATAAAPVELSISIGGAPLTETEMIYTPAVADAVGNVGTETYIPVCGSGNNVTVVNTGENPITVSPNTALTVIRTA
ncbi:MAG: hypothetical protein K2N34_07450 [Lachnospiraceae bacterium]|nr:hypothetical protein [Lachnospiraceae bacterium]